MKPVTKAYFVLCLVVLVAASCGPVTPAVTVTRAVSTRTVAPTHTNTPAPSPMATLSQVEKMFIVPTMQPYLDTTPTPIAAPVLETSSMRLRNLSEEDYLNLIGAMNEYSYRNFPPYDDWWAEGQFISSQKPVALAIQEYLYRYPERPNADRLRWQLAFINSIMYDSLEGNQYGDEWMIEELENGLNRGETVPDQLETILGKYWFDATYIQPMENLFGDGKTGWLYQITPQVWEEEMSTVNESLSEGSMFFVVRENKGSEFKIYLLNSAWNLSFGASYVLNSIDHNKNGIPEIALYVGGHGGTTCIGNLFIYEWRNNSFIDLTEGNLSLRDCSEGFEYSEIADVPAIRLYKVFPVHIEQYIWNGLHYEFSRYLDATPLQVWWYSAGLRLSYQEEAEFINEILVSGEVPRDSAAFSDYLRYRLGTIYAFESKNDESIHEFQNLISSPADPTRTIFSDMAKKFLEKYKGNTSLYDACHQSRLIYDIAFEATRDANGSMDDKKYQEAFGFPFDPLSFGYIQCDEDEAFRLAVASIPADIENIPAELRKMGVSLNYSRKMDINLDGNVEEWFVVFNTYDQFLIFPDDSHYQAEQIAVSIGDDYSSSIQVDIASWDGFKDPIMAFQFGPEFVLMKIDQNYDSEDLIYDFNIMSYSVSNPTELPQLQIFYTIPGPSSDYPDHPWSGYRWDVSENEFKDDLLEYNLFMLRDPEKAVEIIEQAIPFWEKWKNTPDISVWSLPYTYYIAGLSYELSGDQQKAAQIYWQLWHDFPDSHYALMARYKLEPSTP